jgi:hypothetical protein
MSPKQPMWVFYSLRKDIFSYFIEMQMIDDFLLNQRYVNMYALNVLSSFNYVEISMMLW